MEVYDFWSLLKDYEIKIPIIQRDYAQGRNTEFIIEVRNSFLSNLHETLVNDKSLSLDFIYGSIKENINYTSDRQVFLPLDGQQRLTTLFLLHWYLFWKDGLLEDKCIREILSGFKYETRISAREFCYFLVNQKSLEYSKIKDSLSKSIKNEAWFFNFWEKDPTIVSMLNMLDSIHKNFNETRGLGEKLLSGKKNINFRFVKLENFGLDDSLYIKMNARGKLLTPFENFKAKIESVLYDLEKEGKIEDGTKNRIIFKFDREWSDLFWRYRDAETNIYDKHFLALLQTLISYYSFVKEDTVPKLNIGYIEGGYFSHNEYINYIDSSFIDYLEKVLDFFSRNFMDKENFLKKSVIFNDLELFEFIIGKDVKDKKNLTYSHHIMFFGYCVYILKNENEGIRKDNFQSWMRVVSNLAENQIYNKANDAQASIKSLVKLVEYSDNILEYLSNDSNKIRGFSEALIKEERIKAKLILSSESWKDIILEAENHNYFKGQIMFCLDFSNVDSLLESDNNITDEKLEKCLEDFKLYYRKTIKIFAKDKLLVDEKRWRAALLTKGNYLLSKGMNYSFVTNNFDRDISWKRLLADKDKRKFVKNLLDELDFTDINKEFDKIIEEYLLENPEVWYKYFIKYPDLISDEYIGKNLYIRYNSREEIYLLKTSRTSGRIREYYTSVLYLKLKDKVAPENIDIICKDTAGRRHPNYLIFSKRLGEDKENIFIEYKKGWTYKYSEEDQSEYIDYDDLISLLENKDFIVI